MCSLHLPELPMFGNVKNQTNNNESTIKATVRKVPRGRVATYGQIALLAGIPKNARQVGTVLRNLPENSKVPWHRIVNSQGRISDRGDGVFAGLQRYLLVEEGVEFGDHDKLDLARVQWKPKS